MTRIGLAVLTGVVLGVLAWGLARFLAQPWPEATHYHANWLVVIEGQRLDLSDDRYMQDVAGCRAVANIAPAERVHMHDNEDEVVHVHHTGVAWGHFLENLGFDAGPDYLMLGDEGRYVEQDDRTIKYVLNGFPLDDIGTAAVQPGDRLLISYGPEPEDQVVAEQFPRVADNAPEYDERQDPAACAGQEAGLLERLRMAFWGRG